jgi:hypothetical protein
MLKLSAFRMHGRTTEVLCLLVILLMLLPIGAELAELGYPIAHDGQVPYMRVYELQKALAQGQFPPRWFEDFDGGYGSPYPTFYGMGFYYLALGFHVLGANLGEANEMAVFSVFLLAAFGMYWLLRLLGNRQSGLIGAALYTYAPYHLYDGFERGAYSELAAFLWFPLVLLGVIGWFRSSRDRHFVLGATSVAGLMLTHNLMPLMFLPFAVLISTVEILGIPATSAQLRKKILGMGSIFAVAFSVAGYKMVPILVEGKYVRLDNFLYYDYRGDFLRAKDLLGLNPSIPSGLQIGRVQLLILLIAVVVIFRNKDRIRSLPSAIAGGLVAALFCTFLITPASNTIWSMVPVLAYIQFPWRYLAVLAFSIALAGGLSLGMVRRPLLRSGLVMLIPLAAYLAAARFVSTPNAHSDIHIDPPTICQEVWLTQDYRPVYSHAAFWRGLRPPVSEGAIVPMRCPEHSPRVIAGTSRIVSYTRQGMDWLLQYQAAEASEVAIDQIYFPGWQAYVDGKDLPISPDPETGIVTVRVPPGEGSIRIAYHRTGARIAGEALSAFTLLASVLVLLTRTGRHLLRPRKAKSDAGSSAPQS